MINNWNLTYEELLDFLLYNKYPNYICNYPEDPGDVSECHVSYEYIQVKLIDTNRIVRTSFRLGNFYIDEASNGFIRVINYADNKPKIENTIRCNL